MTACNAPSNCNPIPNHPERRAANSRVRKTVAVPEGFPRRNCMGGTPLFKAVFGGVPRSTWASWKKSGKIPKPDLTIGALDFWWQENMHRTLTGNTETDSPAST